ncbi:hypothetical protein [Vibrio nigripulchritudo]|uniref:hypothetical protein n=2 Tax=Vibrio nigripulchritudo TaxID=28173 RepID=UPI00248F94AC|nr:hypothetical protein [Vibrio nigripulchritudo]BDU35749.1 hypothetical protein TUMSATVNIG2_02180 [Vibrio nigripulchritudo]
MNKKIEIWNLLFAWLIEISAFILLPLIVYFITFKVLPVDGDDIYKIPEWMFISVVVFGDLTKKKLNFYKRFEGYDVKMVRTLAIGVLGMVVSSIMLGYSLIAMRTPNLELSDSFYAIQMWVFVIGLVFSAFYHVWIGMYDNDGKKLSYMKALEHK